MKYRLFDNENNLVRTGELVVGLDFDLDHESLAYLEIQISENMWIYVSAFGRELGRELDSDETLVQITPHQLDRDLIEA